MAKQQYETSYERALSYGMKYYHDFRITKKGKLYDVNAVSMPVEKGWKTVKIVSDYFG